MVQLVLIFCLSAGGACIEQRPVAEDAMTLSGCMRVAQPMAAEFVNAHPSYRLDRWKCEVGHPHERAA